MADTVTDDVEIVLPVKKEFKKSLSNVSKFSVTTNLTKRSNSTMNKAYSARTPRTSSKISSIDRINSQIFHKPGEIPNLNLAKNDKGALLNQISFKKKLFKKLKTNFIPKQQELLKEYESLKDLQIKLNKINKKDPCFGVENLKVISFENDSNDRNIVKNNISLGNLKIIEDDNLLYQIKNELKTFSKEGFQICQDYIDKIYDLIKSNNVEIDGKELSKSLQQISENIEQRIISTIKEKEESVENFISNLKNMLVNENGTPVIYKETLLDEYKNYKQSVELQNNNLEMKLKETNEELNAERIKNKEIDSSDIEKMKNQIKIIESEKRDLEKFCETKMKDLIDKEKEISELQSSIKLFEEKFSREKSHEQILEKNLKSQSIELKKLLKKNEKLLKDINDMKKENDHLKNKINDINTEKTNEKGTNESKLKNEIEILQKKIKSISDEMVFVSENYTKELNKEKERFNQIVNENSILKKEKNKSDEIIDLLNSKINESEIEIRKLGTSLNDMNEHFNHTKYLEIEIERLKFSENEKINELNKLKSEFIRAEKQISEQEEAIFNQHKLLKMRNEIIQSFQVIGNQQAGDDTSRLINLSSYHEERNLTNAAQMEEIQNLFSTLGLREMELKQQKNVIKFLEDTVTRYQRTQLKLEKEIDKLKMENNELKNFS